MRNREEITAKRDFLVAQLPNFTDEYQIHGSRKVIAMLNWILLEGPEPVYVPLVHSSSL